MKKSELYQTLINEFVKAQQTSMHTARVNTAIEAVNDGTWKDAIRIIEQSATESAIEIAINALCACGLVEDDMQVNDTARAKALIAAAKVTKAESATE